MGVVCVQGIALGLPVHQAYAVVSKLGYIWSAEKTVQIQAKMCGQAHRQQDR